LHSSCSILQIVLLSFQYAIVTLPVNCSRDNEFTWPSCARLQSYRQFKHFVYFKRYSRYSILSINWCFLTLHVALFLIIILQSTMIYSKTFICRYWSHCPKLLPYDKNMLCRIWSNECKLEYCFAHLKFPDIKYRLTAWNFV
jgi:hypothetical protein